jgi:enediyne biosynthesis protein E4
LPDSSLSQYQHRDFDYNDFKRQPTIPFMYSYTTPVLANADITGDGLDDIFIAIGKGQTSKILIQKKDGGFEERISSRFYEDRIFNSTDAIFFDADKDGDNDLYVTSGMYDSYDPGNLLLNDRLYFNDGSGNFYERVFIETNRAGKSCVRPADFDNDGDLDLFVGAKVVPGRFPEIPESYLLENDGKGNFKKEQDTFGKALQYTGMVSDAAWVDLNDDDQMDLIVCGEWREISVYINTGSGFEDQTSAYFNERLSGFWNTVKVDDIDNDGDPDLIVGNIGNNTQIRASLDQPAEMVVDDFDANGSLDPIFCYFIQSKSYPDVSRDLLLDIIYPMRKKFVNYASYADASIHDIFGEAELKEAKHLYINCTETLLFINQNRKFVRTPLPIQAQFSPVTRIEVLDINEDKLKDIVLLGNFTHARLKYGKTDANFGTVLLNSGSNFTFTPQLLSGLQIRGDVKDSMIIELFGARLLVAGISNNKLRTFRLNHLKQ